MSIIVRFRQGVGLDIEFNEDICHLVDMGGEDLVLFAYTGILINLPFIKIYIGDFVPFEEVERPND